MGDFFDIANLITKVGVEGIKIKPEPGLPEKSSNEILTELFSTFDADEGIVSPDNTDQQVPDAVVKVEKAEKSSSNRKKSKKKHKHKEKRHKKKSRKSYTSDSNSESAVNNKSGGSKKKKKHKKKSKHKSELNPGKSSGSDEPKAKKRKVEEIGDEHSRKSLLKEEARPAGRGLGPAPTPAPEQCGKESSPGLPSLAKKVHEDYEEDQLPKLRTDRSKQTSQCKITIKDLKNSTVYNETVKAIEIKEKAKAARMEDGEISDSSSGNRTPTLSSLSAHSSPGSLSPPIERGKRRTRCSPRPGPSAKNDLRLILKEKEKKRLEGSEKLKGHTDDDPKDIKVHNEQNHRKKTKAGRRKYGSHSPDRKKSLSPTRTNCQRSRSRGKERYRDRSRNRRDRSRSHEKRESGWSRDRRRHRSHSESRSREKYSRARSRSKERKERIEIDKKKLLEIARRNAISMIKQGTLPLAQQDKAIAAIQAGGKTVDELTDFCKSLSKSEALGELSSISSDEDESGSEKGFHHPFLLKERPSSIIMNIKDAKQLPTKTFQEKTAESCNQLRLQFPVSSGQQHRKTENEWVPVIPKKPEHAKPTAPTAAVVPAPTPPTVPTPVPAPTEMPSSIPQPAPIYPPHPVVFPQQLVVEPLDIGTIVSQRLSAMRKLRENPNDVVALNDMYRAQTEMRNWAESKQMPGQFTGSTGVKLLSPAELASGYQAWARKDQLVSAQPVSGGMGMALLQKMGWRPGEGLGKNKEGTLEPLQLEVKLDKRGLVSEQDIGQKIGKTAKPVVPAIKTLEGKHPVSLLGEYCSKRKIGAPVYELCFECGPDHRKNFLFKVRVNGVEYRPTVASPNKKQAKAEAAQICLQTIGLLPEPPPAPPAPPPPLPPST